MWAHAKLTEFRTVKFVPHLISNSSIPQQNNEFTFISNACFTFLDRPIGKARPLCAIVKRCILQSTGISIIVVMNALV